MALLCDAFGWHASMPLSPLWQSEFSVSMLTWICTQSIVYCVEAHHFLEVIGLPSHVVALILPVGVWESSAGLGQFSAAHMQSPACAAANIKKSQADPPQEIRTRVKKDIMTVLSIIMRHLPRLNASALPTLTTEDASAVAQLNYANELRSYVTFCRLLQAWRTDPQVRPQLDRLTNPRNLPPRPPLPQNSLDSNEVGRSASLPGGGLPSPPAANGVAANGAAPSAPVANGAAFGGARPAAGKGASPMLSPSSSGNGADANGAAQASAEAPLMTATSGSDAGTRCQQPPGSSVGPAAGAGGGGGAAAYDSRKVMLAQLIADQVREKTSAITSITNLSDQVEGIMSGSGASGTLAGMITSVEARLKALQEECDQLKSMSKTVRRYPGSTPAGPERPGVRISGS